MLRLSGLTVSRYRSSSEIVRAASRDSSPAREALRAIHANRRPAMRRLPAVLAVLAALDAGCIRAARGGCGIVSDERSLATQEADKKISLTVKKNLLESSVKGTDGLDVFCCNGGVVLAGVVESGSQAGSEAVAIARRVDGVKRVETYFLPAQPSKVSDFAIKQKMDAKLVGALDLKSSQMDMAVIAGHVVLVGVVNQQAKVDKIIAHARSTDGVVKVESFIQVIGQK
jgi:hyperosmotically inducible periplasmic protein